MVEKFTPSQYMNGSDDHVDDGRSNKVQVSFRVFLRTDDAFIFFL